jgi:hypothetical protein
MNQLPLSGTFLKLARNLLAPPVPPAPLRPAPKVFFVFFLPVVSFVPFVSLRRPEAAGPLTLLNCTDAPG